MTQYKRITGKVFGGNATATGNDPQIAQFGSALAGTFIGTADPATIQQLPAWGEGWSGAVTPETQFPPMPEMTGAMKVLSHQICGILQQGVSTWDSGTIYYTGNFCSKNGAVYVSLTDENQGNDPVNDNTNWRSYGGANLDLSNLSAVGEKHFLNKSQITNCLLEVPQTINLEIVNGELVLKAGSKVIIANDYYTVPSDTKVSLSSTAGQKMLIYEKTRNLLMVYPVSSCASGDTLPSSGGIFYLTTDQCVYRYVNSAWIKTAGYALPLGIVTQSATELTSIDQVFNGMGFIGSTFWLDKDAEGLMPNGRNDDGTLNNISKTTDTLKLYTFSGTPTKTYNMVWLSGNTITASSGWDEYRYEENMCWNTIQNKQFIGVSPVAVVEVVSGIITSMKPKFAFRAVDYNDALLKSDKAEIINWGMPDYSSGIDPTFPFTAPSDGVLYFSLLINNTNGNFFINDVFVAVYADNADGAVRDNYTFIVSKGDVVSGIGFEYARFFPLKGAK